MFNNSTQELQKLLSLIYLWYQANK